MLSIKEWLKRTEELRASHHAHSLNTLGAEDLFMGYRHQIKQPRNIGRANEMRRRKKAKARRPKHRSSDEYLLEKNNIAPSEEVMNKTLGRLRGLGNQIFAVFPFSEYFDDWLVNLRNVISDFELDSAITADNQFDEECSRILSNLEVELDERRLKEASYDLAMQRLSDDKRLLERIDEEFAATTREMERRRNSEIKRLSGTVHGLEEELERITQMKTGIFRSISKKAKARKEAEITQRLNSARDKLGLVVPNFSTQQERLLKGHAKMQQPIVKRIQDFQKEINSIEIDGSLGTRRAACEALVNAVNALFKRKILLLQ